ncbi:hypothetical protein [Streptomyces sp. NPDC053813]|uniref:hypothetical protein n=1 Tax=Streptomyces sp. NPDC053813 TaxID=3365717 RepID=UPI0037CDB9FE
MCGCRDDGKRQWAYDGRPVYTFVKDKQPCDTTGDGVKNVRHVARPWAGVGPEGTLGARGTAPRNSPEPS